MKHNQAIGKWGEQAASEYLEKNGYSILFRNWHCEYGELDIIGIKKDSLVFFEVKTRTGSQYGWPEEAITPVKQEHLMNCAEMFLDGFPEFSDFQWQIDVIAIVVDPKDERNFKITHYENAITE